MADVRFAVPSENATDVVAALRESMGLTFEARESHYWGEYWTELPNHSIRVFLNRDPLHNAETDDPEECCFEPAYSEFPVLITSDDEDFSTQIQSILMAEFPGTQLVSV